MTSREKHTMQCSKLPIPIIGVEMHAYNEKTIQKNQLRNDRQELEL